MRNRNTGHEKLLLCKHFMCSSTCTGFNFQLTTKLIKCIYFLWRFIKIPLDCTNVKLSIESSHEISIIKICIKFRILSFLGVQLVGNTFIRGRNLMPERWVQGTLVLIKSLFWKSYVIIHVHIARLSGDLHVRYEYKYAIEYEFDFSFLVCRLHIITSHTHLILWATLSF